VIRRALIVHPGAEWPTWEWQHRWYAPLPPRRRAANAMRDGSLSEQPVTTHLIVEVTPAAPEPAQAA